MGREALWIGQREKKKKRPQCSFLSLASLSGSHCWSDTMGLTSRGAELEDEQRPRRRASRSRDALGLQTSVEDTMGSNDCFWSRLLLREDAIGGGGGLVARGGGVAILNFGGGGGRMLCPGPLGTAHLGKWAFTGALQRYVGSPDLHQLACGRSGRLRDRLTDTELFTFALCTTKPIDTKLRIESPWRLQQISRLFVSVFFFFFSIILYTYSIINPAQKLFHWFILEIADHNTHVLYVLHTGTLR